MSNARVIFLFAAGIVLLVAAHIFVSMRGMGSLIAGRTTLLDPAAKSAERIEVERRGGQVVALVKDGVWRVAEPYSAEADERGIQRMLDALVVSPTQAAFGDQELASFGRERGDYGLDEPEVKITLSSGDRKWSVGLGKLTAAKDGVYASVSDETAIYVADAGLLALAEAGGNAFRMKSICPGGVDSVDSFDLKRGKGQFLRFVKDGEGWRKASLDGADAGDAASSVRIRELLSAIGAAQAQAFFWPVGASNEPASATAPLLASYGLDSESAVTVTLHSRGGADRQVAFGKEASDGLVYALVQNSGAVVSVPGALKDLAGGADFTDSRLFPFDVAQISRVSIADGAVNYLLAKDAATGEWRLDAPVAAPADKAAAESFVTHLASLKFSDRDPEGLVVSLTTNAPPVAVSRAAALAGHSLVDLRSRRILKVAPADVKRIESTSADAEKPAVVVFDKDLRAWVVEASGRPGVPAAPAIDAALAALNPLEAEKVVTLKASVADLRRYGLEKPQTTIAVDSEGAGSLRRNILIGGRAQGGYFATVGSSDAVFIISNSVARRLMASIVAEPVNEKAKAGGKR
ncbi:MAG: DUF4340 domain-containing protein [Kiritimatiellae bacterium]|nr:DUF4340 domain-containing protein [Kiritimatiellia bacterium]